MQWTDESIAFLRDAAAMNRYYETVAEKITPQLQENAHVCDAGCGIGELSLALKPYCRHVTAVDADELAIKTLEAHLIKGVTAICGDYSHHRFSAGKVSLGEYTAGSTEAVLHEKALCLHH